MNKNFIQVIQLGCCLLFYRERERNKLLAASTKRLPLKRGKVSPRLPVPDHIQKPPYTSSNFLPETSREYQIHDAEGLFKMRAACKLAAQVLDYAGTLVRVSNFKLLSVYMFYI